MKQYSKIDRKFQSMPIIGLEMKTISLRILIIVLVVLISSCVTTIDPKTGLQSYGGSKQHGILKSKNGIEFKVDFYPSELTKTPAILLLPGNEKEGYFEYFPKKLNKSGFNVLTITNYHKFNNPRGSSVSDKRRILDERGGIGDIVAHEVTASVNFLRSQDSVDPNRIGILGSSMGTALGLLMAKEDPQIKSLVIVSPGRICYILKSIDKNNCANKKLFLIASYHDMDPNGNSSVDCAEALAKMMPKAIIEKKYFTGSEHGQKLLSNNIGLQKLIIQWLIKEL